MDCAIIMALLSTMVDCYVDLIVPLNYSVFAIHIMLTYCTILLLEQFFELYGDWLIILVLHELA